MKTLIEFNINTIKPKERLGLWSKKSKSLIKWVLKLQYQEEVVLCGFSHVTMENNIIEFTYIDQ